MSTDALPPWADAIKKAYLRGESAVFIVHGNVYDQLLWNQKLISVVDFLRDELLKAKAIVVHYNPALGVRFNKGSGSVRTRNDLTGLRDFEKAIQGIDEILLTEDRVGVVIDYAEELIPAQESSFQSEADRRNEVTVHRWSLDRRFDHSDNIVLLVTELLPELSQKLVSNPKITTIEIPLPDQTTRTKLVQTLEPLADPQAVSRLSSLSAGLKLVQIQGILAPGADAVDRANASREREEFIMHLLDGEPNAKERASALAPKFVGMTHEQIKVLLRPAQELTRGKRTPSRYDDVFALLAARKKEILQKECFGLVEFVEPHHDFDAVGGMDGVKKELLQIAKNIKEGNTSRVPMGLLFVGPMGTGKTFVAEAFAKSSGLTAIKLKNFRSKWVGSTEGNLEKILSVVRAIGNILVIIDEGDRAFGNTDGDGDGGTSSRVIARLKEFMSDTQNRGRVLFVLMTNRPDKLDIDIKRAGRLDRKVPFFYPAEPEEIEPVIGALLSRHKIKHAIEFPRDREGVSRRLSGYSNADIEAIVLLANNLAETRNVTIDPQILDEAIRDYLPSRDLAMLEYMELLAVLESSSRAMLPKKYHDIDAAQLQARVTRLRAHVR